MINSIAGLNPLNALKFIPKPALTAILSCTISEKIKQIAVACLKGSTSLYFGTVGTSEFLQNTTKKNISDKVAGKIERLAPSLPFLNLHGTLMLGCAGCALTDTLHAFGVLALGSLANSVSHASSVLFLCANIVALEENVRLLNVLKETDWTQTNITEKELAWTKHSALWGALSNIGYIIATATLLFSGVTAMTLLVAVLACLAGSIKILYDLALWAQTKNL